MIVGVSTALNVKKRVLYSDEVAMPPQLRKAHQNNDRAVMQAYGFSIKDMTKSKCVAELMKMYQELVSR